jgi:signal recognition particle receptor subunit beta
MKPNAPVVLAGTKHDLPRVVPADAVRAVAHDFGLELFESSANARENFSRIVELAAALDEVAEPAGDGGCCLVA